MVEEINYAKISDEVNHKIASFGAENNKVIDDSVDPDDIKLIIDMMTVLCKKDDNQYINPESIIGIVAISFKEEKVWDLIWLTLEENNFIKEESMALLN